MIARGICSLLALALCASFHASATHPPPTKIQIAEGIYLFRTEPYGDVGLDGNSIAIVASDGVLVFDANGTPAAAEAVLTEIRKITEQPVRTLVISHWHWDHWYGAEVYAKAFPGLQIVAHEAGARMMSGPALDFNRPGLERDLPGYIASLEQRVAAAKKSIPAPADLAALEELLAGDRFFLDQKKGVHHTLPTRTFKDELTLHMGEREIRVLHRERAVTPGDAFLYLPKEKIVITGDLLVNPISFALSCYPSGWLATLEAIDALDAKILVPGHGAPLHDEELLHATMDVFRELLSRGKQAKADGLDADAAREEITPFLHDLMLEITHEDPSLEQAFEIQLVDWFLHRVYDELDGPLSDAIAPIPAR